MDAAILEGVCRTGRLSDAQAGEIDVRAASISPHEVEFLASLIESDASIRRSMEIGCAYGIASLGICQALAGRKGAYHLILDPYQHKHWNGVGIRALERAGCDFFEFREDWAELAMPRLLNDKVGQFDLVFIDGCHFFEHAMLDCYFAMRLVRDGGYIVLDDANFEAVAKVILHFMTFPNLKLSRQLPAQNPFGDLWRKAIWAVFPPVVASFLLPKFIYDRVYARQLFPGMVAFQKVCAK